MYTSEQKIVGAIPPQLLREALDDDEDGLADEGLLETLIGNASEAVDALLCGRYEVPFVAPLPAMVSRAAYVFCCEAIYQRRRVPDQDNPWSKEAEAWRKRLDLVGKGDLDLDAATSDVAADWGGNERVPGRMG